MYRDNAVICPERAKSIQTLHTARDEYALLGLLADEDFNIFIDQCQAIAIDTMYNVTPRFAFRMFAFGDESEGVQAG